jgi:hypothetical protein
LLKSQKDRENLLLSLDRPQVRLRRKRIQVRMKFWIPNSTPHSYLPRKGEKIYSIPLSLNGRGLR